MQHNSHRGGSGMVNYGATDPRPSAGRMNPFTDDENLMSTGYNGTGNYSDVRDSISGDIITINSSASGLERSLKALGTSKDTAELREKIHESELSTNKIINRTATSLKHLSTLCAKADRAERLQCDRLRSDFKEAVQRYNSMQKRVADKVKSSPAVQAQQPPTADLIGWNDNPAERFDPLQQRQQQLVLEEQADTELMLLQEREDQIRQLEGDILDINDIFKQLGTLVHEQGDVIDTIEANVESAYSDVEAGTEQLQKAANYQMRARKKKCCLMIILLVVVIIIVLIIVLSVKLGHKN